MVELDLAFSGEVIYWRGPAPYCFVAVPPAECAQLADVAPIVSYGWGVIPVTASIGDTDWTTSLFPKNGGYLVPIKVAVQRAEDIEVGDTVSVTLGIRSQR